MRTAPDTHVEWVEDEAVILDQTSGQMHYLNPPAAVVWALIQEYGFEEARDRVAQDYSEDVGIRSGFDDLVQSLIDKGLLIDD